MDLRLVAIVVLILLNAFFVSAEFALVRVRRARLESMAREGDTLATFALRALNVKRRVLSASQLGLSLSTLGLGWLLADLLRDVQVDGRDMATAVWVALSVAIVVYLHMVFGELAPRTLALARPERVARLLSPPLLAFSWLVRPLTGVLARSAQIVTRGAPAGASEEQHVHSPDELRLLVERSERSGALQQRDADLLEGVFEFSEKNARDVMTPRTEIVALPADAALDHTMAVIEESGFTRYPVYEGTIDNILGVLLAKDLIPPLRRPPPEFSLHALLRPVHVIPGTREVEEVLADFKRMKEHMAIVLDEYGGTAGIVTMEDLLEEIVGEILDEYDVPDPQPPAPRAGEIVIPGETNIGELNERFGLGVPDDEYTTIGGYAFGALGRIPRPGDSVTAGGATFTVRSLEGRRVGELAVELLSTRADRDGQ